MYSPEDITVVIPAAGEGKRLGLDIPKELYEVIPGKRLIDFTMELIPQDVGKVAVVIRDGKESIPGYLMGRYPEHRFAFTYFDDQYREWPGSVFSAAEHYSKYNVVLLPDTWLIPEKNENRGEGGQKMLDRFCALLDLYPVVFSVKKEDGDVLRRFGALMLNGNGEITRFADKPEENLSFYNGYWTAYGFRKEMGEELYLALIRSVEKKDDIYQLPFPAGGFEIADYMDLGTRESIAKFREKYG